jgi:penicillin-binding protein 1A
MDTILVKILATFLTLSIVTTRPDAIKTQFDPAADQAEVTQIMRDGCAHMRKAFDVESLDIDGLIETAMNDPSAANDPAAAAGDVKLLRGLKFDSLIAVYKKFCKNEDGGAAMDLADMIRFYDNAVAELPDPSRLKGAHPTESGGVFDARGERYADLTESNRRVWVPLRDIPIHVQKAFIAAEDQRFYEHKGIDERGLVRAFQENLVHPGRRPQGGSTITQQVVKNLLVGDDVTYERKMREMIVATQLERTLSKGEILELYLNSIYLGRGSWGVQLASQNYFGKPVSALTLEEGALLAGLPKGPTYYGPDRHPDRAKVRLAYVLGRMQEDGVSGASAVDGAQVALPHLVAYTPPPQRDSGYYFLDQAMREARSVAGVPTLATAGMTVRTTIRSELQRAAEAALQEGLFQYEARSGRTAWHGAEMNLAEAVHRIEATMPPAPPPVPEPAAAPGQRPGGRNAARDDGRRGNGRLPPGPATPAGVQGAAPAAPPADRPKPAWQQALQAARLPLYDVHWSPAIVLPAGGDRRDSGVRVGLADGRIMPLSSANLAGRRGLNPYDVVFVKVSDQQRNRQARVDLRVRPTVQGAAVILDNKTGAVLAMAGGFSYPASQLNRVTQTARQPGSSIKPFTYLAALRRGLQPNTLVRDQPVNLPPPGGSNARTRERDFWSPKNDDGGSGGIYTLRRGLENSKNLVTANLLDGGIDSDPRQSLARVCELTQEAGVYHECIPYYPFVLGAQPARLLDIAAFYAAIATEGRRPTPYSVLSVEQNGKVLFSHAPELKWLANNDRPSFFQLRSMLQGVVRRGTARAISDLANYVGGKTGTSEDENDAWFVGFTNDVTIGVWVGYDNADGKRRTLGGGQTGGRVAVPIFKDLVEAVWANGFPRTPLNPPSPEAGRELRAVQIDLNSGTPLAGRGAGPEGFTEYFRVRPGQQPTSTQYALVSPNEVATTGLSDSDADPEDRPIASNGWPGWQQQQPQQRPGGFLPNVLGNVLGGGNGWWGQRPMAPQWSGPGQSGPGQFPGAQNRQQYSDLPTRNPDDRRWFPPRQFDPDVPWRDRQRGDF